jgi:hypothetical protein
MTEVSRLKCFERDSFTSDNTNDDNEFGNQPSSNYRATTDINMEASESDESESEHGSESGDEDGSESDDGAVIETMLDESWDVVVKMLAGIRVVCGHSGYPRLRSAHLRI